MKIAVHINKRDPMAIPIDLESLGGIREPTTARNPTASRNIEVQNTPAGTYDFGFMAKLYIKVEAALQGPD
jgi:hypothetical protein